MKFLKFKNKNWPVLSSSKGFTLIELMLYVGICGTLLLGMSLFLIDLMRVKAEGQVMAEVEQQGIQVMQMITQSIRNATAINSPAAGVSANQLSLNTTNVGNNPTVFSVSSSALQIKEGSGAQIPLTNNLVSVSNLTFTNLSRASTPGVIRVQFNLSYINPDGMQEYTYSKNFIISASRCHP